MSFTRTPLNFFSLSSLSTSTESCGYSSFIYTGILSINAWLRKFMALLEWPLAMVSSNIALLLLKLRNLNEAGIKKAEWMSLS
jgi:hypothetical protein